MAIAVEQLTARPTYYTGKVENPFAQNTLEGNPHYRKLVELCSEAFFKGSIQIYQNGDIPTSPSHKQEERVFTIDPKTNRRSSEIPREQTRRMPMHISSESDDVYLKQVSLTGKNPNGRSRFLGIEYWQTDSNGIPFRNEDGNPKIIEKVNPALIQPQKTVDTVTGWEVKTYSEIDIIREEIEDLVADQFKDLIEHPEKDGTIDEWINAYEVVPAVIGFMIDKNAYVEGVQKSYALNIVKEALRVARDPDTQIKIVSGFGASDTEPSNCFVGNAIPALEMADKIRAFFAKRQAEGKKGSTHAPIVELVFAQEAGIQANFEDRADSIRENMVNKKKLVGEFASRLYPEVTVVFNQDIPWSELSPEMQAVINYYASIIHSKTTEEHMAKPLAELVASGDTKGTNGSTIETVALYAAKHLPVWGMKPDYVKTQYLQKEIPADVVIRIGPRTEAKFDAMIMAVRATESREGFITHVLGQNLVAEIAEQIVNSTTYQPEPSPVVILGTSLIGQQGPTYFTYDHDRPFGYSLEATITELQQAAGDLTAMINASKKGQSKIDPEIINKAVAQRAKLLSRANDAKKVLKAENRLRLVA